MLVGHSFANFLCWIGTGAVLMWFAPVEIRGSKWRRAAILTILSMQTGQMRG